MTFQTTKKDPNDRGEKGLLKLKADICTIWLGMRDSNPRSRDQNPLPYHLANSQHSQKERTRLHC